MTDSHLAIFEEQRRLLFGLAYRMLGSVADAQDMVQETYLRWQRAQGEAIQSPPAWLTTVITRLCLNQLQSARAKREHYVGVWLPEPLVDDQARDPAATTQLADMLSLAFLVLLETLNPVERAVFILREGFDYEFADIARIVGKSEDNCRQILARARQRVEERRPRFDASSADAQKLVAPFLAALRDGDLEAMLARMSKNVVLIADAGDRPGALVRPLEGAGTVARAMLGATRRHGIEGATFRLARVNGLPGLVRYQGPRAHAVMAFGLVGGLIESVFIISNPDKLRHLDQPGLASSNS
ncbi:MAG TPA: RNA polymerase sigma-70 factor [Lacunisphaera sp.]